VLPRRPEQGGEEDGGVTWRLTMAGTRLHSLKLHLMVHFLLALCAEFY
jgi:hypothetical protein